MEKDDLLPVKRHNTVRLSKAESQRISIKEGRVEKDHRNRSTRATMKDLKSMMSQTQ